jgi:hypothetical protein
MDYAAQVDAKVGIIRDCLHRITQANSRLSRVRSSSATAPAPSGMRMSTSKRSDITVGCRTTWSMSTTVLSLRPS